MFKLMPRENVFFALFNKSASNIHEASMALDDLVSNFTDVPNKVQRLKNLEHAGDEITHRIFEHLAKSFITPLDREDIHDLGSRLDDVLDLMDTAANRLLIYKVEQTNDDIRALAKVLVAATASLVKAVEGLGNMKNSEGILQHCIDVHTQENEGDRIHHHALEQLFDGKTSPTDIIKLKDIYHVMETATDVCEDAANVIYTVVVKNA